MIVVIDGPSGSGKSSIARAVANKLGIQYLDSGALYRAVTWIWLESGAGEDAILEILENREIQFDSKGDKFSVWVDGDEISREIRTERISRYVGRMAQRRDVRNFVNRRMRDVVQTGYWIADGRDLGSVVFPEAELKIFMDAPLELRASRRYQELVEAGEEVTLDEITASLRNRDQADRERSVDPLVKPDDAVDIRNEGVSFDQQVSELAAMIQSRIEKQKQQP
ncbi:MAG: (d)CMP kinase [Bacteroidota bacterium]